jgi:tetratricopeptide (TPR) repeat protein
MFVFSGQAVAASSTKARSNRAQAVELFNESEASYKAGRFRDAADQLRRAYELDPDPVLLYNLARALESDGDLIGSAETYERFLEAAPKVDDRASIEQRIANLRKLAMEREVAAAQPPSAVIEQPPPKPSAVRRAAPYAVIGLGAAGLATGGVFGAVAMARHRAAVAEPVQVRSDELQSQARREASIANVAFAAGGAVAVSGLIWVLIDRSTDAEPAVAFGATHQSAWISVHF